MARGLIGHYAVVVFQVALELDFGSDGDNDQEQNTDSDEDRPQVCELAADRSEPLGEILRYYFPYTESYVLNGFRTLL